MQLQNPQQNEQLQALIVKANEAIATFDELQRKATEIHTNIERNKKTIEALQNENAELQAKSDKVTVSATGEVNFSEFDDYSDQIFANVRKIKALENVISRFEKELELLILDECQGASRNTSLHISNLYDYYGKSLLDELCDEETVNKLNKIFYLLRMSRTPNKYETEPQFFILDNLKKKLDSSFVVESSELNNVVFPTANLYGYGDSNPITSVRKIAELKQQLGKEE